METENKDRKETLTWVDKKFLKPNDGGKQLCAVRNERLRREREWRAVQLLSASPSTVAPTIRTGHFLFERLKQAGTILRMFHFSLQFGRLRIEITRASSKP